MNSGEYYVGVLPGGARDEIGNFHGEDDSEGALRVG